MNSKANNDEKPLKKDARDTIYELAKSTMIAASAAAGTVGGPAVAAATAPLSELFGMIVKSPIEEKRDRFMEEMAKDIASLKKTLDELKEIVTSNEFIASFVQATPASLETNSEEKLEFLRNAVLNSAILHPDEDMRHKIFTMLRQLTPSHIIVLSIFDNPYEFGKLTGVDHQKNAKRGATTLLIHDEVKRYAQNYDSDFIKVLIQDLSSWGLIYQFQDHITVNAAGKHQNNLTYFGREFVKYIKKPN